MADLMTKKEFQESTQNLQESRAVTRFSNVKKFFSIPRFFSSKSKKRSHYLKKIDSLLDVVHHSNSEPNTLRLDKYLALQSAIIEARSHLNVIEQPKALIELLKQVRSKIEVVTKDINNTIPRSRW